MPKLYDRVKQLCDTSFTGTVNIRVDYADTAINGYRRFSDVMALGTSIFYVVESTDASKNEWECGYGVYDSEVISSTSRRTITRNVLTGSNGTSKVVFTSGGKVVYVAALARTLDGQVKTTFEGATEDPNETYDADDGYSPGSLFYRAGKLFVCTDSTSGAAVWTQIATLGGGNAPTKVSPGGDILSFDATPFVINSVGPAGDFGLETKQPYMIFAQVTAYDSTADLTKGWRITAVARLDDGGTANLIGTPEIVSYGDTGTASWNVTLSGNGRYIDINGVGDATNQLSWNFSVIANRSF